MYIIVIVAATVHFSFSFCLYSLCLKGESRQKGLIFFSVFFAAADWPFSRFGWHLLQQSVKKECVHKFLPVSWLFKKKYKKMRRVQKGARIEERENSRRPWILHPHHFFPAFSCYTSAVCCCTLLLHCCTLLLLYTAAAVQQPTLYKTVDTHSRELSCVCLCVHFLSLSVLAAFCVLVLSLLWKALSLVATKCCSCLSTCQSCWGTFCSVVCCPRLLLLLLRTLPPIDLPLLYSFCLFD